MNDAMGAAVHSAYAPDRESWKTLMEDAWSGAVEEVVQGYFKTAQHSFENGQPMEGVETLTDAVRATLGHIAATREWPHSTDEDLYSIARPWPAGTGGPRRWKNSTKP